MDDRIRTLIDRLKELGYTDRYVAEHWGDNWRERRWYDKSAPDSSILQVITANQYLRINLTDVSSERPFAVMLYVSWEHPIFPKCGFSKRPEVRLTMKEVVVVVEHVARSQKRREAA